VGAVVSASARTQQSAAPENRGEESERELAARVSAAYQQGMTAGEAAATQRAQGRLEPVLANLNAIVSELAGLRKKFRGEAEEATVALAVGVARRVLNRELASDPEALLGLVKAAFHKCDARETHKLRLSTQDAAVVQEFRARLNLPPALEIVADGSLPRGSVVFETSRGELDASFETQLDEIERGLADVVKRRRS
jgi:flagellar assembly protein FliH